MSHSDLSAKRKILTKIYAHAKTQEGVAQELRVFRDFVGHFYAQLGVADLQDRSVETLYGAAFAAWRVLKAYQLGSPQVRVYNPTLIQEGWESAYTYVCMVDAEMPFMAESMHVAVRRKALVTYLSVTLSDLCLERDEHRNITSLHLLGPKKPGTETVSLVCIKINRLEEEAERTQLREDIESALQDVHAAVEDWDSMKEEVLRSIKEIESIPVPKHLIEETQAFLRWLQDDHFTFIGYRRYRFGGQDEERTLRIQPQSGLGVLRTSSHNPAIKQYSSVPPEARKLIEDKEQILIISQTNTISTVHRHAYTTRLDVTCYDETGAVVGLKCFIGLFTASVYQSIPQEIPVLRDKVQAVVEKAGFLMRSHSGKRLLHILGTLPRDDLFQGSVEELHDLAVGVLHLQDRRVIRLFVRRDPYERYLSCFVYMPRESFSTELFKRIETVLLSDFSGNEITSSTQLSDEPLARIHSIIRFNPPNIGVLDIEAIEKQVITLCRSWKEGLLDALVSHFGDEHSAVLLNRYGEAFPVGYKDRFTPEAAITDIRAIERLGNENDLGMIFYRPEGGSPESICFKLFRLNQTIPLSDVLPMLENMGLRVIGERPYELAIKEGSLIWINDFNMTYSGGGFSDIKLVREKFQETFYECWRGHVENDGFNRLVLEAGLDCYEIALLRAYYKYLRQIGFTLTQEYIEETLAKNPTLASCLVRYFHLRFDPDNQGTVNKPNSIKGKATTTELSTETPANAEAMAQLEQEIGELLESVASLDQDRIIRAYLNVIQATLRTNFYQRDTQGLRKPYMAFKIDSQQVHGMPKPIPKFDAFVYSPRFEGIHLRMASVARGGIRWSERVQDVRTEVRDLVKAQQVKNAVIVPSGAKGGFVLKRLPADASRDQLMAEGITCYQNFIRGLLDMTDNLSAHQVVCEPARTVCYDKNDFYLVVAADKGTASFSDYANAVSQEYGYWLADAFASGGSVGYDHKKMGITARGVWESVLHHFKKLTIDVQKQPITVLGIGDMAGDVFGNGLLLSEALQLVAAFNHQHIFIDPNPDPKVSFKERKRIFALSRSTWADYDRTLLSSGGGIFERSAKSITISPEAKIRFNLSKDKWIPNELIKALLQAEFDLLWNGGIGTFVKAANETHTEVADRTNDAIRVDGSQLRCRVVAEGGNLGFTQRGRIEFELSQGGMINTDFIDNSGGVDCSDHEVNIKILLNEVVRQNRLTEVKRNQLLVEMTNEVAHLVLKSNRAQNEVITLVTNQSSIYLPLYQRFLADQETKGIFHHEQENLPDNKALEERKANQLGLTRPEVAVLLAYSKISLKRELLQTDLPENLYFSRFIELAFPKPLREQYAQEMKEHRLHRELIVTQLSNTIVDDMGPTFIHQLSDETGAKIPEIVRAYAISREVFGLEKIWEDISSLDYKASSQQQDRMQLSAMRLIRRSARWFLRNHRNELDVQAEVDAFGAYVKELSPQLEQLLVGQNLTAFQEREKELMTGGVPRAMAKRMAGMTFLYSLLNVIEATRLTGVPLLEAAQIYYQVAHRLDLDWFREAVDNYPVNDRWSVLARAVMKGDLDAQHLSLAMTILKSPALQKQKIDYWLEQNVEKVERWDSTLLNLRSTPIIEFDMLTVLMRELSSLS